MCQTDCFGYISVQLWGRLTAAQPYVKMRQASVVQTNAAIKRLFIYFGNEESGTLCAAPVPIIETNS